MSAYERAKEMYGRVGVDTEKAMEALANIPISMHCWQGDDVRGFEGARALSGGIQATGSYPGSARTPDELMRDIDMALSLIPGKHRINLHASYAIFEDGFVDRDKLEPKHFAKWAAFAKARGLGLDMNPTYFSHPLADGATLSSANEQIRRFWIEHTKRCLAIAEYFARELGKQSLVNIWIPDGLKDMPADRLSPRRRLISSLDEALAGTYDKRLVRVSVESKVFGIGLESFTVGSHEFYMQYAASRGVLCLLDSGHYHPTESIADKLSSLLLFSDKVALHVTRAVRWDSDHVLRLDDDTRAIAREIVACGQDNVLIGLDYFDASVNRVAAWVVGMRAMQKALLEALLLPDSLRALQEKERFWELLAAQEELKGYPAQDVWAEFCARQGVPANEGWMDAVRAYERDVLSLRI